MDKISPEHRSWNMSRIRSKDTSPEKVVRSFLHRSGIRFRLHDKTLPGSPDIVLKKYLTAIFVHGCFWHRHHGCKLAYMPKSRVDFWQDKFSKNIARDQLKMQKLKDMGWKVLIVWECETKDMKILNSLVDSLLSETKERV